MTNSGSFAMDIRKFVEKQKARADLAVGSIVAGIAAEIDFRSPVGDPTKWRHPERAPEGYVGGRFRANWQLGVGSVPGGTNDKRDRSAKDRDNGGTTTHSLIARIPKEAAGKIYYLANNLPYARELEYGHSTQAPGPGGIVGLTISSFQQIVRKALAELPE